MVKDGQVRRLWREMESPAPLVLAARRAGMSEKTARHYRDHRQLPNTCLRPSLNGYKPSFPQSGLDSHAPQP